jgi:endonuclease III
MSNQSELEEVLAKNTKRTSKPKATKASKILKDPNSSKTQKSLAASVLSQRRPEAETSEKMDDLAAKVLSSEKYAKETKELAGSVLSQANGKEK